MAKSGIYEIVNLVNGKRYVGSAANFVIRWRQHKRLLNLGQHYSPAMQRAWRKYGAENFEFRIIRECERDKLIAEEQAELDRQWPEYNNCPTAGSSLGRKLSTKTRTKIAASKVGLKMPPRSEQHRASLSKSNAWKGKGPPDHVMRALQEGRRKRVFTDEQRAAVSEALKQCYSDGRKSRDRPPEYRAKISEGLRRHAKSPEVRERLREQARKAWANKTPEERAAHMEKVRAGRRR